MKALRDFLVLSMIIAGAVSAHEPNKTTYFAYHFPTHALPTIDGDLSDWDRVPPEYHITLTNHFRETQRGIGTNFDLADLDIKCIVGWNEEKNRVYSMAYVVDDYLHNSRDEPDEYNFDDAWNLVINADHSGGELMASFFNKDDPQNYATAQVYQVHVPPLDGYWAFMYLSGTNWWLTDGKQLPFPEYLEIGWARTGATEGPGTYTYELKATPWQLLDQAGPEASTAVDLEAGKNIHIGFLFKDYDLDWVSPGGYQGSYYFPPTDHDLWQNTGLLADFKLLAVDEVLGMISGEVTQRDGSPWAGVPIRVEGDESNVRHQATTSAEGRYQIWVAPGSYRIRIEPDKGARPVEVSLKSGEQVDDIDFAPDLGGIAGRVTHQRDGSPWAEAPIRVEDHEGKVESELTTDADGQYQAWVMPGSYRVSVVDAEDAEPVEVRLEAGEQVDHIDFAPTSVGPTIPTWPFTAGLVILGVGILACVVPLAQRRGRLGGILLSPGHTLQEVAAQPDWVGPFFLVLASSLLVSVVLIGKMLTEMDSSGGGMSGVMQIVMMVVMPIFTIAGILAFNYLAWLVRAGLIWLLAQLFGERVAFYSLLSVVGYAKLPELLFVAVVLAGAISFDAVSGPDPWSAMVTSLAGLFPNLAAGNITVRALLGQIELFGLWSLVLTIVGVQRAYGFSMGKGAVIVILYWILVVGIIVVFFALIQALHQMI